jgi:lambda family phage holin
MIEQLKELPPSVLSFLLAVVIATIRVIYDKEETSGTRVFLESVLCGALAVTAGTAIQALGLDTDWTLFAGGMIGFIGSQSIRKFAENFISHKITKS